MKMLNDKKEIRYLMAFIVPFIVLISMTVIPTITSIWGSEILIETKPVDPRDVFRGDYVRLEYKISEIELGRLDENILNLVDTDTDYKNYKKLRKKNIYVSLIKKGKYFEVKNASFQKPDNGLYLTGKYRYTLRDYNKKKEIERVKGIVVNYSLDKYFVPENTGIELEEKSRKGQLLAKLKVFKGYALLIDVIDE